MTIEITAFKWVPDFAQGYVKDLRVRWALEEAGLTYTQHLIDEAEKTSERYLGRQPFAQVPVYKDDDVELFESGAILIYLSQKHEVLAPRDPAGQARATSWVCAALNSIEPFVMDVVHTNLFYADAPWAPGFSETAKSNLENKLERLSHWLGQKDWLESTFSIGDIMMVTVLRDVVDRDQIDAPPNVLAYCQRGEARPAFQRAHAAQLKSFEQPEGTAP